MLLWLFQEIGYMHLLLLIYIHRREKVHSDQDVEYAMGQVEVRSYEVEQACLHY